MDAHRNIDTIKLYVSLSKANTNKMLWILLVVANNDNTFTLNYVNGLDILFSLVFFSSSLSFFRWPLNFFFFHKISILCKWYIKSVSYDSNVRWGFYRSLRKFIIYFPVLIYYPGFLYIFSLFFFVIVEVFAIFFLVSRSLCCFGNNFAYDNRLA